MHRQTNDRPQGYHRGNGRYGDSGSSDGCAYSSSSGGSNRPAGQARPVIRPFAKPVSRVRTPEQSNTVLDQIDSPTVPDTPGSERASFTLNGHQIRETYTPRLSVNTSPPKSESSASLAIGSMSTRPSPAASPPTASSPTARSPTARSPTASSPIAKILGTRAGRNGDPLPRLDSQPTFKSSITRNARLHWALKQEFKVKLLGIPKHFWIKDIYFATSKFGTVTKIDIQPGSRDNNARVIFQ